MPKFSFRVGRGKTKLHTKVSFMGEDIVIFIYGGKAHIGSIAVGVPRPSLKDKNITSSTTSIFNITGHKDDYLSKPLAEKIAAKTGKIVTVLAGFHIDNITDRELKEVFKNFKVVEKILLKKVNYLKKV